MKILLINGSPKGERSNSLKLARAFAEGIGSRAETELEIVDVSRADIQSCRGCFACWKNNEGRCVIKDDMAEILKKYLAADVILWSFGLYYFSVPSKLKALIDRQLPMVLPFMEKDSESGSHPSRYDLSAKRYAVVSTCGFYAAEGNYDSVNLMFDHFLGKDNYAKIYCSQGELFGVKALKSRTDEYLEIVREAGEEFAEGAISDETMEELAEPLYPREAFEEMADASWGIEEKSDENKSDPAFFFTRQMAAMYNKASYPGRDIVIEMDYTDLGTRYQMVLGRDGHKVLKEDFLKPTTVIHTPFTLWQEIGEGKISGAEAMMKRLYTVDGDFSVMNDWDKYFGSKKPAKKKKSGEKPTSLWVLLIPWIAFWVGGAIDSFAGVLAVICVTAAAALLFRNNEKTVYDYLSSAAVTAFSVALVATENTLVILPLSYLAFGLMWSLSCLTKIPLTAHYSKNSYNGDDALKNPLFVRTNLILTLAWGVLYVLTAVWTFFLIKGGLSGYTAIINNILPILMGIFTGWFQNWYPAHFAKGKALR